MVPRYLSGLFGWVSKTYISAPVSSPTTPASTTTRTNGTVNMLSGPGASHSILRNLLKSAGLKPLCWKGNWTLASTSTATGWVCNTYIGTKTQTALARNIVRYRVVTDGAISTDVNIFKRQVQETLDDSRGWRAKGMRFEQVSSGGSMIVVLANGSRVSSYLPGMCVTFYSCQAGTYVVINQDRWKRATPARNSGGGSLRDYRHIVVNHEVGHWLRIGHRNCSGAGNPAPVMQQQSFNLQGCQFNPWPLSYETTPRF